jgi:hypothetical protein
LCTFFVGLRYLYIRYRNPTNSIQKAQIRYILTGIVVALVPIIIINAILPVLSSSDTIILYGPNAVIIMAIFMSIAIIKHRLLDIRLIVARSVAYLFTLGTVASVFVVFTFGVFAQFLGTGGLTITQQAFYIFVAISLAVSFQSLKKFFDRTTNRLFYQDSYEPQILLDGLNKVLVGNIQLKNF